MYQWPKLESHYAWMDGKKITRVRATEYRDVPHISNLHEPTAEGASLPVVPLLIEPIKLSQILDSITN